MPHCLLVVHAHPDDEVFSTGGTIARYAAAGDRVVVVYATNGEAGEMHDAERDPEEARQRLGEIRRDEARAACQILGVTDVVFLDYRDSGMKDTEDNQNPANFMNAPLDEAVNRLLAVMQDTRPQVVITYDTDGGYGHPDHVKTNVVTTAAFERAHQEPWGPKKLYYSTRSREGFRRYAYGLREHGVEIPWIRGDFNFDEYGVPDEDITAHIDIASYVPLKQQALGVHRTQIPPEFFYLSIPSEALSDVAGVEYFMRIEPPHHRGEREEDVFAGLPTQDTVVA
jgi:N-acetyl-1-D-myo-inositol-2-amino-2-deoxy-alpha-D-glucopyranoside deacetylase